MRSKGKIAGAVFSPTVSDQLIRTRTNSVWYSSTFDAPAFPTEEEEIDELIDFEEEEEEEAIPVPPTSPFSLRRHRVFTITDRTVIYYWHRVQEDMGDTIVSVVSIRDWLNQQATRRLLNLRVRTYQEWEGIRREHRDYT